MCYVTAFSFALRLAITNHCGKFIRRYARQMKDETSQSRFIEAFIQYAANLPEPNRRLLDEMYELAWYDIQLYPCSLEGKRLVKPWYHYQVNFILLPLYFTLKSLYGTPSIWYNLYWKSWIEKRIAEAVRNDFASAFLLRRSIRRQSCDFSVRLFTFTSTQGLSTGNKR